MVVELAPTRTKLITDEELAAMGDIGPCELIEGRIVPMTPTGGEHGRIEVNRRRATWVLGKSGATI